MRTMRRIVEDLSQTIGDLSHLPYFRVGTAKSLSDLPAYLRQPCDCIIRCNSHSLTTFSNAARHFGHRCTPLFTFYSPQPLGGM